MFLPVLVFLKGSQAHYLADNMDADNKGKSLEDGGDKLAHLAHHPRAHHRRQHSLQLAPHHIMTSHQPRVTTRSSDQGGGTEKDGWWWKCECGSVEV